MPLSFLHHPQFKFSPSNRIGNLRLITGHLAASMWLIVIGFGFPSSLRGEEPEFKKYQWITAAGLKIRLNGKLHLDFTDGHTAGSALPYDVSFRRLRVALRGKQESGLHFKIQCDFSDEGNAQFKDVYLGLALSDSFNIRVGQLKEPIGLEWLTGSNDLIAMERAPQAKLLPKREVGVLALGSLGRRSNWAFGYFLNSDDLGHASDEDDEAGRSEFTGRLTCMPWGKGKSGRYLHLGLSVSFRDWDDDRFQVESPGALPTAPDLFDFADFRTSSVELWEGDAALSLGSFFLQNESVYCTVDGASEAHIIGNTLTLCYALTGEHRTMKRGKLSGLIPQKPFRFNGGGGALEVFSRYAFLDTTKTNFSAQELRDAVLGLSWVLLEDVRVMLNGVYSVWEQESSRQITRGVHLRFQLGF